MTSLNVTRDIALATRSAAALFALSSSSKYDATTDSKYKLIFFKKHNKSRALLQTNYPGHIMMRIDGVAKLRAPDINSSRNRCHKQQRMIKNKYLRNINHKKLKRTTHWNAECDIEITAASQMKRVECHLRRRFTNRLSIAHTDTDTHQSQH